MRTDTIIVSSRGNQMEAALKEAEKVAAYKGLSAKNALHLRLLTEEMMGMMRSITGENTGEFWIEDKDNDSIELKVQTLTYGTEYKCEVTGVTKKGSSKKVAVKGSFTA